jgi:hypothetical protein
MPAIAEAGVEVHVVQTHPKDFDVALLAIVLGLTAFF